MTLKHIPFHEPDFFCLRSGNFAYVDKTRYIERLERQGAFLLIRRPRRFGLTLFASVLTHYYDTARSARFKDLFAGTYIGAHPTASAHRLFVLKLDFSAISDSEGLRTGFTASVRERLSEFFERYPLPLADEFLEDVRPVATPAALMRRFFKFIRKSIPHGLFIITDEYDQSTHEHLDKASGSSAPLMPAWLNNFYSVLHDAAKDGQLSRLFICGVTDTSLEAVTTCFPSLQDLTDDSNYEALFGFTENELRTLLDETLDFSKLAISREDLLTRLMTWYGSYRFAPGSQSVVLNPSMCLFYLHQWKRRGRETEHLLNPLVYNSKAELRGCLEKGRPADVERLIFNLICGSSVTLDELPETVTPVRSQFTTPAKLVRRLANRGFLTYAPGSETDLIIPNRALRHFFCSFYFQVIRNTFGQLFDISRRTEALHRLEKGDPTLFFQYVADEFALVSNGCEDYRLRKQALIVAAVKLVSLAPSIETSILPDVSTSGAWVSSLLVLQSADDCPSYLMDFVLLPKTVGGATHVEETLNTAERELQAVAEAAHLSLSLLPICAVAVFSGLELKASSDVTTAPAQTGVQ